MSRVTKLQKAYRKLYFARHNHRGRNWAKGRRLRAAARQKSPRCACGHRLNIHGDYGCRVGCAWGSCGYTLPVVWFADFHAPDLPKLPDLKAITEAFKMPSNHTVLLAGDSVTSRLTFDALRATLLK